METKNTYWNHNGKHQAFADALNKLIPAEGEVPNHKKNKALEKFRNASNCYYDLYNNGLCNRARQFAAVFKIAPRHYTYRVFDVMGYRNRFNDNLYTETEKAMDFIVLAAAAEQKIETPVVSQ